MKKKFCGGILIFALFVTYFYLQNTVPDEVKITRGDQVELQSLLPLSLERKESENEVATFASMVLKKDNVADMGAVKNSYTMDCRLFGVIPLKEVYVEEEDEKSLIPGGIPVGIYVKTKGVLVIGTSPVTGLNGQKLEPAKYLLKSGDYIQSVDGQPVSTKEELIDRVNQCGGQKLVLGLERNGESIELAMEAVQTGEQSYKIGVWVRDDLAGVGTMTFTDEEGRYGALGHGVSDADTSTLITMEKGLLYRTDIVGIIKGQKGSPGELSGVINYSSRYCLGSVEGNTRAGVYGKLNKIPIELKGVNEIPLGYKQEVHLGKAEIICTLEKERKSYEIEITQTNYNTSEANKGIQFVVTDKELLEKTGGIVQGMSGSPIIQNGKLIGAVTHVFVQDAARGYGIFAEKMVEESNK